MRVLLANGPNLSQLGYRDPQIYGSATLADIVAQVKRAHDDLEPFTTEHEGALIERLHAARADGTAAVVINPGALAHYSYALRDALELLALPKVEVHISQTAARESFRHHSVIAPVVDVTITGAGAYGYELGVLAARHLHAARHGDA
ncbi:MAG TPA: type II 3-dehydroquinate dehydratase [Euzebyales bacterium]|nr:type II 3-dehydroquinate dehydratase [Euzebyales bacterium]